MTTEVCNEMGSIFILILIIWLILPIPLLIFWLIARSREKRQAALLRKLIAQQRIQPFEVQQAGLEKMLPAALRSMPPPQPAVPTANMPDTMPQTIPFSADTQLMPPQIMPPEVSDAVPENIAAEIPAVSAERTELPTETVHPVSEPPAESEPLIAVVPSDDTVSGTAPQAQPQYTAAPPVPVQPAASSPQAQNRVSAITVMLSVGVLLIIIAGLIFVRSAWGKLTDAGRLATLAAGSVLFFGTSVLARRIWKLNRTSMAFFTLGSAFLPISVWAAGYLGLLGDGLSKAGDPRLIALAFGSFTIISLIAVLIYRLKSWGIAFLCGLTVCLTSLAGALPIHPDAAAAPYLFALSLFGLFLAFTARIAAPHIPKAIGSVLEPFTIILNILASIPAWIFAMSMCVMLYDAYAPDRWYCAVPAFFSAFAFFAPVLTERLKKLTAVPVTLLTVPAFTALLLPSCRPLFALSVENRTVHAEIGFIALILMLCAFIWLLLLLTNSLPDETRSGFLYAAAVLTAASILVQFMLLYAGYPTVDAIILLCAAAVLLAAWILTARKTDTKLLSILIGVQLWSICLNVAGAVYWQTSLKSPHFKDTHYLIEAGCFLLGFAVLVLLKKHRTGVSDLLLTVSPAVPLFMMIQQETPEPLQYAALIVLIGIVLLMYALAFAHDTRKPEQHIFAVLSPLVLALTAVFSEDGMLSALKPYTVMTCWSICSFALGFAAYLTTKRQFHTVRKMMFALTIIPPIACAVGIGFLNNLWCMLCLLVCMAAAASVWRIFSAHGFRKLAAAAFGTALFLLLKASALGLRTAAGAYSVDFTMLMIASVWVILFALLALAISRRMFSFVGGNVIADVMQYAVPLTVLLLSILMVSLDSNEWNHFYFVYVFGMCILAWFTTKKSQIIMPAVCALSLIISVETLRFRSGSISTVSVIIQLLGFACMTVLFPYLGIVSRETDDEPRMQRRSWVLTVLGGIVPFWLLYASETGTISKYYTDTQTEWMKFFVPIFAAGYLLHFLFVFKDEKRKRRVTVIASALGMIAFWMQPFVNVQDTWFEGKLHIIPLIAFGVVLRMLYGEKKGGMFLFGVGIYTMLRLAFTAISTEAAADLLTVLAAALLMFIVSFFIKQKKWFLLGGVSLILSACYMHMKITDGKQWWVYLLLAGLILIVVAGSNEMLKQRGDSLKSKAGRFLEDWTW